MTETLEFYNFSGIAAETGEIKTLAEKAACGMESLRMGSREWLGWLDPDEHAGTGRLDEIESIAKEAQDRADIFILIGVGGSNNGARAVLKALNPVGGPEFIYSGINLSPSYMKRVLEAIRDKSVYINVIAKNFATLEPGIAFRFLRQTLEERYGKEAGKRIMVTGSRKDTLFQLAKKRGWRFLDFPENMGGRYSVISAVGLFPMACGGVDIRGLVAGARDMALYLKNTDPQKNPALRYAAVRNALYRKGYTNELLVSFEYEFEYFAKWFVQLFAESEGKDGKGIFPSSCVFSEDLHSLGQYIQQGRKMIMETFLRVKNSSAGLTVKPETGDPDGFGYLDGKDLADINRAAYDATFKAHTEGGVPCMTIEVQDISPYSMGQLFYFFEYACAASGFLAEVNPFDQPGVEAYKQNLFAEIGK
jgi:glucose-6-phosphate isomerase